MKAFYDFVQGARGLEPASLPAPEGVHTSIASTSLAISDSVTAIAVQDGIGPKKDAKQFGDEMAKLVTSDDFLMALSNAIQQPMPFETEEQFVARAKTAVLGLIDQKLGQ